MKHPSRRSRLFGKKNFDTQGDDYIEAGSSKLEAGSREEVKSEKRIKRKGYIVCKQKPGLYRLSSNPEGIQYE